MNSVINDNALSHDRHQGVPAIGRKDTGGKRGVTKVERGSDDQQRSGIHQYPKEDQYYVFASSCGMHQRQLCVGTEGASLQDMMDLKV